MVCIYTSNSVQKKVEEQGRKFADRSKSSTDPSITPALLSYSCYTCQAFHSCTAQTQFMMITAADLTLKLAGIFETFSLVRPEVPGYSKSIIHFEFLIET